MRLTFDCAVVDRQSFLDGTRELTLEGSAAGEPSGQEWLVTLTLRWPKDEAPDEGDLAITGPDGAALYAALDRGTVTETTDDAGDDGVELALVFAVTSGEGGLSGASGALRLDGTIIGDEGTAVVIDE